MDFTSEIRAKSLGYVEWILRRFSRREMTRLRFASRFSDDIASRIARARREKNVDSLRRLRQNFFIGRTIVRATYVKQTEDNRVKKQSRKKATTKSKASSSKKAAKPAKKAAAKKTAGRKKK